MKPKFLEFKGINSFSEKVEINFEKLLKNGIFGIFGDTGSGKSTILDAINFALYGEVDRKTSSNAEIINNKLDKAFVNYEFEICIDGTRKIYRVEREINKTSLQKVFLFERVNNELLGICDGAKKVNVEIENIIGLNFEEFKKCIALPQGEFSAFVKATKGERLTLIARLFDLENYGLRLNARIKNKRDTLEKQLASIEGELNSYQDISKENLENLKNKLVENSLEIEKLNKNLTKKKNEYDKIKIDFDGKSQFDTINAQFNSLFNQNEEMSMLKQNLSKLPSAKQITICFEDLQEKENELEHLTPKKKKLVENKEDLEKKKIELENVIQKNSFDNEIERLTTLFAKLDYMSNDATQYEKLSKQRQSLLDEYKKVEKQLNDVDRNLKIREAELGVINAIVDNLEKDSNAFEFLSKNLSGTILKNEYTKNKQYFADKKEELSHFDKSTPLYVAVDKEVSKKIEEYSLLLKDIENQDVDTDCLIATLKTNNQSLSLKRDEKTKKIGEIEGAKVQASSLKKSLEEIFSRGNEIKEQLNEIKEKISNSLCEQKIVLDETKSIAENLSKSKESVQKQLDVLKNKKDNLNDEYQNIVNIYNNNESELKSTCTLIVQNEFAKQKVNNNLKKFLAESGFRDVNEAKNLADSIENESKAQQIIDNYFSNLKAFEMQKENLKKFESVLITDKDIALLKQEIDEISSQNKTLDNSIAILQKDIETNTKALTRKEELLKQSSSLQGELKIVSKLSELCKGNKFMEFVADEYLTDISHSASKLLLELTNGKYFIKYNNGFQIGDNHAGGECRAVQTLSGGETFLVSLSLALSLSSAIFEKSLRPIEFFFLDEGFGSLDSKLIDTVMDSLEKLKNNNFSIGLISHIEELKNRIPYRIEVTAADEENGSKVSLQC